MTPFKILDGLFGLTLTPQPLNAPCSAVITPYSAFSCQITSAVLIPTPNISSETLPPTWCDPEETIPRVGVTTYSLEVTYLQDPNKADGLARFLYEADTQVAYFYVGLAGDSPPKAIGKVRLTSGSIGGDVRTTLMASAELPCIGKPGICFGDDTTSVGVGGEATA